MYYRSQRLLCCAARLVHRKRTVVLSFAVSILFGAIANWRTGAALAQEPEPATGTELAFSIFQSKCMQCHGNPRVSRAPSPSAIRAMTPERIYQALTTGVMKVQAESLSDAEKKRLAHFMTGRPLGSVQQGDAKQMPNQCPSNPSLAEASAGPSWNGWGVDERNSRFQSAGEAGLTADQVPKLKLKWAFGFPGGVSSFAQPTVVSGRVFLGSDIGYVYSLDAETGCVYWSYRTKGSVRTAISLGPNRSAAAKYAIYFGDKAANVYALDAQSGQELWVKKVDDHLTAQITAAPTLYAGQLYVGVSSFEEIGADSPDYPCCTFRGSVVALDARSGTKLWKTYVMTQSRPTKKNSKGVQLYGPAGASVWNSPTVDVKRRALYFGTGNSQTCPAAKTSDAVMALSMDTGRVLWSYQELADDCMPNGPDADIGNSPVLQALPTGRRVTVVATGDGYVLALDPDNDGNVVWKNKICIGESSRCSRWGGATDGTNIYYGIDDPPGGMVAIRLATGERLWFTKFSNDGQVSNRPAASGIPGVAFVGGTDGKLHAVATADGRQIWEYDTAREFDTLNKVPGKGGSMGAPGPVIVGGMLFVNSGYNQISDRPGNVVLAFGLE